MIEQVKIQEQENTTTFDIDNGDAVITFENNTEQSEDTERIKPENPIGNNDEPDPNGD